MNPNELSQVTCDPIQAVGSSFYFDPGTVQMAKELGINVYEFYGLGRAGVMGNVEPDHVERAFTFFHPRTIAFIYTKAREKADAAEVAVHHLEAAYRHGDRTFGAVPVAVLAEFAAATQKVSTAVPHGQHLVFDGYRKCPTPGDPVHAAIRSAIVLRELRMGVHVDAVREVGLSPLEACFLQDLSVFALHGYVDADAPVVIPELTQRKARAEELTNEFMAGHFAVLDEDECHYVADGALSMFEALKAPVPVAR